MSSRSRLPVIISMLLNCSLVFFSTIWTQRKEREIEQLLLYFLQYFRAFILFRNNNCRIVIIVMSTYNTQWLGKVGSANTSFVFPLLSQFLLLCVFNKSCMRKIFVGAFISLKSLCRYITSLNTKYLRVLYSEMY